ncbi:MAG: leucine-rich repeat protein [Treponema sp.]
MKTTIFRRKAQAFLGAAAVLLAAAVTAGCSNSAGSSGGNNESGTGGTGSQSKTFAVTFAVDGTNGTLKAEVGGGEITSGKSVEQGKTVIFTAKPADGYGVDKWTITGSAFEAGTGTGGKLTAKVKITANTKVNVSFKTDIYKTVPFADLNTYLQTTASSTGINYIKVTGLTAANLQGTTDYSPEPSALGKILNDNPTKKVALKLEEIPELTDMSYCFRGCTSLAQAPDIQSSVTNMNGCFRGCTSLTQAPEIPSSVNSMNSCFSGCKSLTQAPEIPSRVTDMQSCFSGCTSLTSAVLKCNYNEFADKFKDVFAGCEKLMAGSIKVPAGQLQTYKDKADKMGAQKEWFAADN